MTIGDDSEASVVRPGRRQLPPRLDKPLYRMLDRIHLLEPLRRLSRRRYMRRMFNCAMEGKGLVPERDLTRCLASSIGALRQADDRRWDYLEFGVCFGSSMACMHDALTETGNNTARLFGFDSFEGLPNNAADQDDGLWSPGELSCPIEFATKLMTSRGVDWSRTFLIRGWFSQTLNTSLARQFGINNIGIVMIDSDLYLSARQALDFVGPRLAERSVILFDDWKAGGLDQRNMGEKRAFDEFMAENPHLTAESLPPYSDNSAVFLVTRPAARR